MPSIGSQNALVRMYNSVRNATRRSKRSAVVPFVPDEEDSGNAAFDAVLPAPRPSTGVADDVDLGAAEVSHDSQTMLTVKVEVAASSSFQSCGTTLEGIRVPDPKVMSEEEDCGSEISFCSDAPAGGKVENALTTKTTSTAAMSAVQEESALPEQDKVAPMPTFPAPPVMGQRLGKEAFVSDKSIDTLVYSCLSGETERESGDNLTDQNRGLLVSRQLSSGSSSSNFNSDAVFLGAASAPSSCVAAHAAAIQLAAVAAAAREGGAQSSKEFHARAPVDRSNTTPFDGEWVLTNNTPGTSDWLFTLTIDGLKVIDGNGESLTMISTPKGPALCGGILSRKGKSMVRSGKSGAVQVYLRREPARARAALPRQ